MAKCIRVALCLSAMDWGIMMIRNVLFALVVTFMACGVWMTPGCGPAVVSPDGNGTSDASGQQDTSGADTATDKGTPDTQTDTDEGTTDQTKEEDGTDKAPSVATSVETKLGTNSAMAGESVVVTCKVLDQYGQPLAAQTKVTVDPEPKGFVKPTDVVIHEAGEYKVACQLVDGSLTDTTPETLTIVSAEAATVDTELDPIQIRAGETTKVTCKVSDRFGNQVVGATSITVTPKDGISIKGQEVSGTKLGQYLVACALGKDGSGAKDDSPASLEITPGLPAKLTLAPDPSKPYYKSEEVILLERTVYDAYGNEVNVPHKDIKVVSTPNKDVDTSGYPDSIAFKNDGTYKVVVSIESPTHEGKPVSAEETLVIDGHGPKITLTSPARAAMLTGSSSIIVQGNVKDTLSGTTSLKVNGKSVTPDGSGNFSTKVTAKWGINPLVIEASDKAGNAGYYASSYLWSTSYKPMGGTQIARGAIARLNQKAIDDGDRSTINDLGTILERVLNSIDIDQQVPQTLTSGRYKIPPFGPRVSYSVTKTGKVTMGKRQIKLTTRAGGVSVWAKVDDIRVPLRGYAAGFLRKSATVVASSITLTGTINMSYSNGQVVVTVPSLTADVSNVKVNAFSGVFKFLNGAVTSILRSSIKKALENSIKGAIPGPIKNFLEGLKLARDFTLPSGLGSKVLKLDSKLDYLVFDSNGGSLGLAASLTATKGIASGKLGTPLRSQQLPTWGTSYAFGVALSDNIVNQVLTAAWYAGALKQDISSKVQGTGSGLPLDPQGLKVKVEALLPPILHPGTGGNDAELGVGDLALDVEFSPQGVGTVKAKAFLTARFGAKLGVTSQNEVTIQIGTTPLQFAVEVTEVSGLGSVNIGELGKLLQAIAPQITQFLSTSILQKLPLPKIDLSSFAGKYGIPAGSNLTIKNGKISAVGDYLKITGDL